MRFIAVSLVVLFAASSQAQDSDPRQLLYSYLQAEARKHFDARRDTVANLKTPDDIRKRQAYLKQKFLEALGGFPEKTPLNAKVVGTIHRDGFRVEKVIYESRPNHHVTANLYLPDSSGPVPGVLLPCGHSDNGKAAEAYQRACMLLAQNGMAVLCYDPIGQGERNQLLDKKAKPAITGTSEHTMIGVGALLVGQSTATYRIWDGIRSLDYLESRPEIDPKRLGCTGNSGGGTLTSYLMALDDRIAAAAPSCYLTTLEKLFATIGPQDAEQNITGQVAFGMEHADYITMRAPRPTLMCVGTFDYFNIDGAWTTFREASLIYSKLGFGERVALFEFPDKHGFSQPRREAAMRWLRRWLVGKDDAPVEKPAKLFTDAELQCTRSGQVLEDFKGKSVFHLNVEKAKELAAARVVQQKTWTADTGAKAIKTLLGFPYSNVNPIRFINDRLADLIANRLDKLASKIEKRNGLSFVKAKIQTEANVTLNGAYFLPERGTGSLTIYVHGQGYETEAGSEGEIGNLVRAGHTVLAVDLRGMGESAPGKASAKPSYFGTDSKEAFLGLHVNRTLLSQRVHDLHAVVTLFSGTPTIEVIAVGSAAPIALHAAALDKRITKLTLEKSLVSWQNVVETPISYNQLTNVVPGALRVYDLPDLAAMLAPRSLTIKGAVDARGEPVSVGRVMAEYRECRERYARLGAERNFAVEP